ncbi:MULTISPECIES: hypothetical protein [unclassified Nocardiopsis]|uniref:hypothetical protein n=1 Tax=unclassified Nocardiopsis TaxID=2649073 RepID=UPI0013577A13|nr:MULTISPECIES: hypothetical protein [unclassified Nocardiopsis]
MTRDAQIPGEDERRPAPGGIYVVGSMTGGAVATGPRARAEDRSRREGAPTEAELTPPGALPVSIPPGQVLVGGHMTGGAVASAEDAEAIDSSVRLSGTSARVLTGLAEVRRTLADSGRTFESAAVDGELARAQQEIEDAGEVRPGILRHLLSLLRGGSALLEGMARDSGAVRDLYGFLCALEAPRGQD